MKIFRLNLYFYRIRSVLIILFLSVASFSFSQSWEQQADSLRNVIRACDTDTCQRNTVWKLFTILPRGNADTAFVYATRLKRLANIHNDPLTLARSYLVHAAINLTSLSRFDSIKMYADNAFNIIDTTIHRDEWARINNHLAICSVVAGNYVPALAQFKRAKEIYRELGKVCSEATMDHNMGKIYKLLGHTEETGFYIKQAIDRKKSNHCTGNISYMYLNLCAYFETKNLHDSVQKYAHLAVVEDKLYGSVAEMGPSYLILSKSFLTQGLIDSANYYIDLSIDLAEREDNIKLKSFSYLQKSKILHEQGDPRALPFADKALSFVRPQSSVHLDILKHKSDLLASKGEYKRSLLLRDEAQVIQDSLAQKENYAKIKSLEAKAKQDQISLLEKEGELLSLNAQRNKILFLGTALLFLFGGLFTYAFFRQRKRRQASELAAMQQQKDLALLKSQMELMRTRMNPHFIFNSLNSIKAYFIKNDQRASIDYLNSFSSLIREVLENSHNETISIESNKQWIEKYCQLEKVRLNDDLDYQVHISDSIDQAAIFIPPMLIQPFVENAIWHGLSPKPSDRTLHINYSIMKEGFIECIIDDNGVGFQADKIKENGDHTSLGSKITAERLAAIQKFYDGSFSYEIIHKAKAGGVGTKVVLTIPYIKKL